LTARRAEVERGDKKAADRAPPRLNSLQLLFRRDLRRRKSSGIVSDPDISVATAASDAAFREMSPRRQNQTSPGSRQG